MRKWLSKHVDAMIIPFDTDVMESLLNAMYVKGLGDELSEFDSPKDMWGFLDYRFGEEESCDDESIEGNEVNPKSFAKPKASIENCKKVKPKIVAHTHTHHPHPNLVMMHDLML